MLKISLKNTHINCEHNDLIITIYKTPNDYTIEFPGFYATSISICDKCSSIIHDFGNRDKNIGYYLFYDINKIFRSESLFFLGATKKDKSIKEYTSRFGPYYKMISYSRSSVYSYKDTWICVVQKQQFNKTRMVQ